MTRAEAPLGDLIRDLGQDGVELVRQEINLAKLEIKESVSRIASGAIGAALWAGVALVGGLALTACLILLIGMALGGAYWGGALIVGAVFVLLGGLMAWRSVNKIRETDLRPEETISTLKEDRRWLGREAREFRRELRA